MTNHGNDQARRKFLEGGLGLIGAALLAGPARADASDQVSGPPAAADEQEPTTLDAWVDRYGRPTAKVMVNGQGPFSFLVDTGANVTVLTMRRARELGLAFTGTSVVNGTTGNAEMPVASIADLRTGVVNATDVRVAVLPDAALSRVDGILGADIFAGKRLYFDIQGRIVRVMNSRRGLVRTGSHMAAAGNIHVRNGKLAEIDGKIGRISVRMMLDTGAENCIINPHLEERLAKAFPMLKRVNAATVIGVTGQVLTGDLIVLPDIHFANVILKDATGVATNAPIFDLWDLNRVPAMIVGVNVLSRLSNFTIDYGSRQFEAEPLALLAGQARQFS